ncbi:MAG: hypothetical protein OEW39_06315 [Deltaproteobacteria bacterium]|nr:hypothetical protein [Deltaproteobacteria bacterium]
MPETTPTGGALTGRTVEAEIFSVGEWNGETFTEADLREIARNFQRLREYLKPPLKFGHDEDQTLLGQRDGDPALGWVAGVRVLGNRLLATFVGVPEVVYQAVKAGRYRRVSAELYFKVWHKGRLLGKALKAVALLGADLPAVTNLRDLGAYLATQGRAAQGPGLEPRGRGPRFAASAVFTLPVRQARIHQYHKESDMTEPNLPKPPGEELQAELNELRAYKSSQEQRQTEEHQRRNREAFQTLRRQVVTFCQDNVRAGRLSPHLSEHLLREVDRQTRLFTAGAPLSVPFDWVRRFVEQSGPVLPVGETAVAQTSEESIGGAVAGDNPSAALARVAGRVMAERHLTYSEAAACVLRENAELARSYRDFTLNPYPGV